MHLAALDTAAPPWPPGTGPRSSPGTSTTSARATGRSTSFTRSRPGALITVTGPDHAVTTWRVYKTAVATKTALPAGIWSLAGPRRLVLVTCGGPIEHTPAGRTYLDNVLIYATPGRG